jgi:D-cysteine desulfhydrase
VGATVHTGGSLPGAFRLARRRYRDLEAAGARPFFIMVGGTSRLGCVGHLTAGLELAAQIARGDMPEPDLLFVPLGTCGTAAGLVAGLALAGLRTQVAAVRVAERFAANSISVRLLAQDVIDHLHRLDPKVPRVRIGFDRFDVVPGFLGAGYGRSTPLAEAAVEWAAPRLSLETTYSGKALAAALEMSKWSGTPQTFLFWNTFSSAPFPV